MLPNYDYIRGLVAGEGCFTFCSIKNTGTKKQLPTFLINMSRRDKVLLEKTRDVLGLKNKIYEYPPRTAKDGYKRDGMVLLIVRDIGQIKNIIVPLFYKKLIGYKSIQFNEWMERIGNRMSDSVILYSNSYSLPKEDNEE